MTTMRARLRKDECDDKLDLLSHSGRGEFMADASCTARQRDPNFCVNLKRDKMSYYFKIIIINRVIKIISYCGIHV